MHFVPPWTLITDPPLPGYLNMARDQALLDRADGSGEAVLRLYRWDPHCISFGRNEPAGRRYDKTRISELGLDCVRRPTGGRAVWHARELTYSVAAPLACFGSLREAYRSIHMMLSHAVAALGGEPSLAAPPARHPGLDAGACFASPAGGEVMVRDSKVIGSAQVQQGSALLQHGSFLLEDDQATIQQVTLGSPPPSRDTPLSRLLGRPVQFEEVAVAIRGAAADWSSDWPAWKEPEDFARLVEHHGRRFRSPEWTWRR
jgi:lipoyl(octanoyl) transferase